MCGLQNVSKEHAILLIQANEDHTFARLLCSEAILEGRLPPPGRTPRVWYKVTKEDGGMSIKTAFANNSMQRMLRLRNVLSRSFKFIADG